MRERLVNLYINYHKLFEQRCRLYPKWEVFLSIGRDSYGINFRMMCCITVLALLLAVDSFIHSPASNGFALLMMISMLYLDYQLVKTYCVLISCILRDPDTLHIRFFQPKFYQIYHHMSLLLLARDFMMNRLTILYPYWAVFLPGLIYSIVYLYLIYQSLKIAPSDDAKTFKCIQGGYGIISLINTIKGIYNEDLEKSSKEQRFVYLLIPSYPIIIVIFTILFTAYYHHVRYRNSG